MDLSLVTPPSVEPVSLTEVKKHLRMAVTDAEAEDYTDEDAKLTSLIKTARETVENHTGRALITQTWDAVFEAFPLGSKIPLPFGGLQSVTSVSYVDADGVSATFTDYSVKKIAGRIQKTYGISWPSIYPESDITIRFVCGYGSAATDVPASIKQAMLLIIGHLYNNTDETVFGVATIAIRLPLGVDALLAPFRLYKF